MAASLVANIGLTDSTIAPGLYAYDVALGSSGGPTGAQAGILLHQRRRRAGGPAAGGRGFYGLGGAGGGDLQPGADGGARGGWISGAAIETVSNTQGRYMSGARTATRPAGKGDDADDLAKRQ